MQSNTSEMYEYLIDTVVTAQFSIFLVSFIFIITIYLRTNSKSHLPITTTPLFALMTCLFLLNATLSQDLFKGIQNVFGYAEIYRQELSKLQTIITKRKESHSGISATTDSTGNLHVLVIGESLSKHHLSSYGYRRETTPWITSSKPIQFEQAYSSHTHTMETLSLALTQSNQYNQLSYYESASLIDVLNQANFHTAWISNQVSAGIWDNLVSALAHESDYVRFINTNVGKSDNTRKLDDALVKELEHYLNTIDESNNHFIVLHMMGSHISYCDRTKGKDIALEPLSHYTYLGTSNLCYDQSVALADTMLEKVHNLISKSPSFSTLIFIPDHGEDVFANRGHDAKRFTEPMVEVPFLIWTGSTFNQKQRTILEDNKNKVFTNDLLFDSVLGILDVDTSVKQAGFDISSPNYNLSLTQATTMHGKVAIQSLATQKTRSNLTINPSLMAHRVNTIGMLDDVYNAGFKRIEVDLWVDETTQQIKVGHDLNTLSEQSLGSFLEFENEQFEELWFDVKNLTSLNLPSVRDQLESLDQTYNLKSRTLLETSSRSDDLRQLSELGWKISYYLPTKKLTDMMTTASNQEIESYTTQLFFQLNEQSIASMSFDSSLLLFVDEHFTQKIINPLQLELNTWTQIHVDDNNLKTKLDNAGLHHPKINNIIVIYNSQFRL
ncbi:phosphoethanolamine transferase [Vibrio lamellibrachiae]|uniref:phosphoethanolamine transferase n=1 Tax=Vibrio lamellibrachiae TaxID=2910253 RepID=UPI003D146ECF